jgi:hypothetical protein
MDGYGAPAAESEQIRDCLNGSFQLSCAGAGTCAHSDADFGQSFRKVGDRWAPALDDFVELSAGRGGCRSASQITFEAPEVTWPVGRAASRSALRRIWPARPDLAHGFASRPHSHHQESTGAQLPPQPVKAGDRPPVAPADTAGADRRPWSRPIAGRFQAPQLALFSGICHSANRRPI